MVELVVILLPFLFNVSALVLEVEWWMELVIWWNSDALAVSGGDFGPWYAFEGRNSVRLILETDVWLVFLYEVIFVVGRNDALFVYLDVIFVISDTV